MIERLLGLQTHQVDIVDFFFDILHYMLEQCGFGGRFDYVNSITLGLSFSWLNMLPE